MEANQPFGRLGERLARARVARGEKQGELAKRLAVSQQSVSRWEAGTHRPKPAQIAALSDALQLPVAELIDLGGYAAPAAATTMSLLPVDMLDAVTFERFVKDLVQELHPTADVRLAGGSGHTQEGLDILAVLRDGRRLSFQCKKVERFGPADVAKAVKSHVAEADERFLVLSRIASPQAAQTLRGYAGWKLWDKEDLSGLVRMRLSPEVQNRLVDIYFRGQRMALLGREEIGPWLTLEEFFAPFQGRAAIFSHDWDLRGRDVEVETLRGFLGAADHPIVLLGGPGGMGKSRILKEAIERYRRTNPDTVVRFLSPAREATPESLASLGSRPKILVVDDAHDREGLGQLLAYVANPANAAQLLLAARPYSRSRLLQEAAVFASLEPIEVKLEPLDSKAMILLVEEVLRESGGLPEWAEEIAKAAGNSPLVAVMAARVVAREGLAIELAKNEQAMKTLILGKFTAVVTGKLGSASDEKLFRNVLDLLALIQPFHIEDRRLPEFASVVKGIDPDDLARALRALLDGGIIYRRGHNYRLMPDLLGDYLIESSCVGLDGRLTPLVGRALDAIDDALLKQMLVNLGRMDWRLSDGDPSSSVLLDSVWRTLRTISDKYDPRLEAVQAVAMFQPRQALEFVQHQIEEGRLDMPLSKILRGIAFNYDYLDDACELLWAVGCDDDRARNPHPEHPIRVLAELCGFAERKPLRYSERVFAFGMKLFDRPDAWRHSHSPFDIVEPILAGEGMITRQTGFTINFSSFFVDYDVVADLRQALIEKVIELLDHADPKIAYRAARFLEKTLRSPIGLMNSAAPLELLDKYRAESIDTLAAVEKALSSRDIRLATAIGIARSVSWHAHHARQDVAAAAQRVLDALPPSLDYRVRAAFADGYGRAFIGRFDADTWRRDIDIWLGTLARELLAAHPEPNALLAYIEAAIDDLKASGEDENSAYLLLNRLFAEDRELSRVFVADGWLRPGSSVRRFVSGALYQLLEHEPEAGRREARRFLESGDARLSAAAASAYHGLPRSLSLEDIALIRTALASPHADTADAALRVIWSRKDLESELVLELVMEVRFERSPALFDEMAMILDDENRKLLSLIGRDEAERLLRRMVDLPTLEGHWTTELLIAFSERFPNELASFLFARLEQSAVQNEINDFLPSQLRHGGQKFRFEESGEGEAILRRTWLWLRQRETGDGFFDYLAGELFDTMFPAVRDDVVQFLDTQLDMASGAELRLMSRLLARAHHNLIFMQRAFVERFLTRCRIAGPDVLNAARGDLFGAAVSGMKSGTSGQPMPRDVEAVARSTAILADLSRTSPAWRLYEDVRRSAQADIDRSRREAEAVADE